METLMTIFGIIMAGMGAGTVVIIVAAMIGTIVKKIYRKIRYGASLYD